MLPFITDSMPAYVNVGKVHDLMCIVMQRDVFWPGSFRKRKFSEDSFCKNTKLL